VASSRSAAMRKYLQQISGGSLRNKKVTFCAVNLCGVLREWEKKMPEKLVSREHTEVLALCVATVHNHRGIPDIFSGDRVQLSFNGVTNCTGHKRAGAHFAFELVQKSDQGPKFTGGVCTGDGKVGNMGIQGLKKFAFLSTTLPFAWATARLARGRRELAGGEDNPVPSESLMWCDQWVQEDAKGFMYMRLEDVVTFAKRAKKPVEMYRLLSMCEAGEDEWMYQLEEGAAKNPEKAWNDAFHALLDADWDKAQALLPELSNSGAKNAIMVVEFITSKQSYTPTPIAYH